MLKKQETGRSMVEMLGVLAIVGLLSITGLQGYISAMNRYHANELINEANKRATVVAIQLASGKTAPKTANKTLISEFTDPTDYSFSVGQNPKNAKQFNMKISGVSEEVCEQIRSVASGVIRGVSDCPTGESGTLTLTFNEDMSQTPYASDYADETDCLNAGKKWCKYNSTCRESECPNPTDLLYNEDECLATGYKYYRWGVGAVGVKGCTTIDVDCEDCNYSCFLYAGDHNYVKSKEDCPGEMYFTSEACYEAGFYWKCDYCQLLWENGPC